MPRLAFINHDLKMTLIPEKDQGYLLFDGEIRFVPAVIQGNPAVRLSDPKATAISYIWFAENQDVTIRDLDWVRP